MSDAWRSGAYVSTYCNYPHRVSDGMPIEHTCRVIPPDALQAEREERYADAQRMLQYTPAVYRKGVPWPAK